MSQGVKNGLVAVLVIFFLVMFADWLFSEANDYGTSTRAVEKTHRQADVSEDRDVMREGYMQGCVEGESEWTGYCDCTYDYVIDNYGTQGMIEIASEYDKGNTSERMKEAAYQCIDEVPEN